jgi:hypothetical protein
MLPDAIARKVCLTIIVDGKGLQKGGKRFRLKNKFILTLKILQFKYSS